jgi:hypothetical protein
MGEKQNQSFQLSFNPALRADFQGSRVTSDGGLLLVRSTSRWKPLKTTRRRSGPPYNAFFRSQERNVR